MELDILLGFESKPAYVAVETPSPKPIQVAEKKPAQIPRSTPKSISIKQAFEEKPSVKSAPELDDIKEETETETDDDDFIEEEVCDNAVNQLDVDKFWQKFIEGNLSQKPRYASMLTSYPPILLENNMVKVTLESQLQADMLNEIKNDITAFLRKKTGCKSIEITSEVTNDNSSTAKIYTPEDKLKFLSQQNPNVLDLMKQLNLDFD